MTTINGIDVSTFKELRESIRLGNEKQGFHDIGHKLRARLDDAEAEITNAPQASWQALAELEAVRDEAREAYTFYLTNRITLVMGEIIEAHEELRSGKQVHEVYYSDKGKPEGFIVELADAQIRLWDLFAELERVDSRIDFDAVIEEKLRYNETRSRMHGRKF